MNVHKFLLGLIIIFCPCIIYCTDTIRTNDGGYGIGRLNSKKEKVGVWTFYNSAGYIQSKSRYKDNNRLAVWTIKFEYEDGLKRTGKYMGFSGKTGKWKTYDEVGKLIKIERYKKGHLHGVSRDLKNKKRIKYHWGYTRDELYNEEGKRYVFYLTVGKSAFRHQSPVHEKCACIMTPIAGCMVTSRILREQSMHNFFVNIKQTVRFGFRWKNDLY